MKNDNFKYETATDANVLLGEVLWDADLQNVGLPSNMQFTFGSEFGDIIYRLQKPDDKLRWCVFKVNNTYYVIKQKEVNNGWMEEWTKQMNENLLEARQYAEGDAMEHFA